MKATTFTLAIVTLCIALNSCGTMQKDEIEGVWENVKVDTAKGILRGFGPSVKTLVIRKVGLKDPAYFVFFEEDSPMSAKKAGDNLIHYFRNDSITIMISPDDKTLKFDRRNIIGMYDDPQLKRTTSLSEYDYEADDEDFFDMNPYLHQSGLPGNFLPSIKWLPFKINPAFIRSREIESITIPVYTTVSKTKELDLQYNATFTFNEYGNLEQVVAKKPNENDMIWTLQYRDDADHSLEKIIFKPFPSFEKVYTYDRDSWLTDELNQKKITTEIDWTYNKSDLPMSLSVNRDLEWKVMFEYNFDDQLTGAYEVMGKSYDAYRYEYENGVLSKVIIGR